MLIPELNTQQFLERVRGYAALFKAPNKALAHRIVETPVRVSWHYLDPHARWECLLGGQTLGGETHQPGNCGSFNITMFPFAFKDKMQLAHAFIHELAHVITEGPKGAAEHGHDEAWARNARRLGIEEVALGGRNAPEEANFAFNWLDPAFESYVYALPYHFTRASKMHT